MRNKSAPKFPKRWGRKKRKIARAEWFKKERKRQFIEMCLFYSALPRILADHVIAMTNAEPCFINKWRRDPNVVTDEE